MSEMPKPGQLKEFLLHPDPYVREAVVQYFEQCHHQDPDLLLMVLEARRRYGDEQDIRLLARCRQFPQSEESLAAALATLTAVEDRNSRALLNRLIAQAPLELLAKREAEIAGIPQITEETRQYVQRRREMAGRPSEELWQDLQEFAARADRSEEIDYVTDIDQVYQNLLIEALSGRDVPDPQEICRRLESYGEEDGDWLEFFLVQLAGARRLKQAVPALVAKLHIDADYLREECVQALGRIGDAEAVRRVRAFFPHAPWNVRLYAHSVFGRIKHPESEEALLELVEDEPAADIRTGLCEELLSLFSPRGVDAVLRQIKRGYDTTIAVLQDDLLPVAEVLGIELPEAANWRNEREERYQNFRKQLAWMDELARKANAAQGGTAASPEARGPQARPSNVSVLPDGTDPLKQPTAAAVAEPARVFEPETSPAPIRRDVPKVGRNEPCPCGSGKKYKRCCGRK